VEMMVVKDKEVYCLAPKSGGLYILPGYKYVQIDVNNPNLE